MNNSSIDIDQRNLFCTPVITGNWEDADGHNPRMIDYIRREKSSSQGVMLSNIGGWQSEDDLFKRNVPSITALRDWLFGVLLASYDHHYEGRFRNLMQQAGTNLGFECTAWANINFPGCSNKLHNHPGSHWSGVYYLHCPNASGDISFLDPRMGANMSSARSALLDLFSNNWESITPSAGMAVVFPSWLYHSVGTNLSDADRISIAFNIALRKA